MNATPSSNSSFDPSNARAIGQAAGDPGAAGSSIDAADLLRIERALLDAILDVHPHRTNALDRLLQDMDAADGANDDTTSAADRDAGTSRRKQVEALLVAAVLDTTPADRSRELDRLLGQTPDPGLHAAYA